MPIGLFKVLLLLLSALNLQKGQRPAVADGADSGCSSWTRSRKIGSNWKGREGEFLDERSLRVCGGGRGSVRVMDSK